MPLLYTLITLYGSKGMNDKKQPRNGRNRDGDYPSAPEARRRWEALFREAPAGHAVPAPYNGPPHTWTEEELKDLTTVSKGLHPTTAAATEYSGDFTAANRETIFPPAMADRMDAFGRYKRLMSIVARETATGPQPVTYTTTEPPERPRTQVDARGSFTLDRASYEALKNFVAEKSHGVSGAGSGRRT